MPSDDGTNSSQTFSISRLVAQATTGVGRYKPQYPPQPQCSKERSGRGHIRPPVPDLSIYRDQGFRGMMKMISEALIESRMRNERTANLPAWLLKGEYRMSGGASALRAIEASDGEGSDRKRRPFRLSRRKEVRS